jgi:LuxR family transcriptional regulator, positive regulator of biofilm formation
MSVEDVPDREEDNWLNGMIAAGSADGEHLVYVIGTENFFHQALCVALEKRLGITCRNVGDVQKVFVDPMEEGVRTILYLINHSGMNFESVILNGQMSRTPRPQQETIVALFNLPSHTGMEKSAFSRGIRGFFYRNDDLNHLSRGVSALLRGDLWVPHDILVEFALKGSNQQAHSVREKTMLTERESQILAMVSVGSSNEEIAEKLYLSPHTVKTHLYNVFKKINVPNRFQAALWAAKNL